MSLYYRTWDFYSIKIY